jgi:hypothetical protein
VKNQIMVEGVLDVPDDALGGREMGLTGGHACGGTPIGPRKRCQA